MVDENWRQLAEAARDEEDPERLLQLVEELNQALQKSVEVDPRPPILSGNLRQNSLAGAVHAAEIGKP